MGQQNKRIQVDCRNDNELRCAISLYIYICV